MSKDPKDASYGSGRCSECGAELPPGTISGQCPKCLLKAAMAAPTASGPGGTIVLPPPPTSSRGLPQPGEKLGHYEIIRLLGAGGMGAVFESEDLETGRRVALKVLSHTLDLPEARERFLREGRLAASINHPNSIYVFGTEEIAGTPVIAMELVSGGTLQDRIRAHGPLPASEAVDCILQIIAGLEAAQRIGILHRDVKPSNCYLAEDGTVKIGDFGLSISTAVRTEPALTASGIFLGTPAFCSPEQLRGDELNARSDMYSVGATLFYLLTGRTPFDGKNHVQLLATVLEEPAPSPRKFSSTVPQALARIVLRCLEKHPGERFKSYHELANALVPFSSAAPTPATLGLRAVAGLLDMLFLSLVSAAATWLTLGNPAQLMSLAFQPTPKLMAWMLGWAAASVLYYAAFESWQGATPGKALCRLRVVSPAKSSPAFFPALLRAIIYIAVPVWPSWLFYGSRAYLTTSNATQSFVGLAFYILLAGLFCTARRRNGFGALHDLATNTRVISRAALQARPVLALPELPSPVAGSEAPLGPYRVLQPIEESPAVTWLLGYDLRLLRKVWLRVVQPGSPPFPGPLRSLGRPGRLRWLTGRRSAQENWDAFEAPAGKPLLSLLSSAQPWSQVRFWLFDLATELSISEKDSTLPETLALDRIWITAEGRAKLLDFTAPGLKPLNLGAGSYLSEQAFLTAVAHAALSGDAVPSAAELTQLTQSTTPALPLPLHTREFLKQLPRFPGPAATADSLKPLLERLACVSRLRRAAIVAGCIAFPLFMGLGTIFGMAMMRQWSQSRPGLWDLNSLLQARAGIRRWGKHTQGPTDDQFAIYIASHYANFITNQESWSDASTLAFIRGEDRRFAEQSVAEHPSLTSEQVARNETDLKPFLPNPEFFDLKKRSWLPLAMMGGALLGCVGLPALLAALAFRGGLILRLAGITFVRRDGIPASRLRLLWRALVTWAPVPAGLICYGALGGHLAGAITAAVLLSTLALLSLALPIRGFQDRLAGTWPVPK